MAYNPYNAGNEIVKRKKQWAEATANGKDASSYAGLNTMSLGITVGRMLRTN